MVVHRAGVRVTRVRGRSGHGGRMDEVFTVADARAAGVSDWAMRHGGFGRPARGWRVRPATTGSADLARHCLHLVATLPPGVAFSHGTALDLLGVDRPRGLPDPDLVHIEVPATAWRPRRNGLRAHRMPDSRRTLVRLRGGLLVVPPLQVWMQTAGQLVDDEVVVLGDALLRRRRPWCTLDEVVGAIDRVPAGTRGRRRLFQARARLRVDTDSCQETRLRLLLVASDLPCPEVNRPITDNQGRFVALPDLSYPAARLAIEYDGDVHRTDPATWQRDIARRRRLTAAGWRLLTCTSGDLRHPGPLLTEIRGLLSAEGAVPVGRAAR